MTAENLYTPERTPMEAETRPEEARPPESSLLCVDLDGTLVKTDLLFEMLLLLLKRRPLQLFKLPVWLLGGKAHLKRQLARRVEVDVTCLPYHEPLLAYLSEEHLLGRTLVLATATDERVARKVAGHLGIFDEVVASDGVTNCSGRRKAEAIKEVCGERGFTYVGDAPVDLEVWEHAGGAVVVGDRRGLEHKVARLERTFGSEARPHELLHALRVHQWVKNLLVFVPLFLAHQVTDAGALLAATLAFLAFCCCASAVYVQNDLLDLEADRHHPHKRRRPFAAGALSIRFGLLLAPALLVAAAGLAFLVSPAFAGVLGGYFAATLLYSLLLKRKPIVDVLTLALLYTLRIVAGGVAIGAPLSPWLLAFSLFFFLSLAYVKRFSELRALVSETSLRARGYTATDLEGLADLGVSSGYVSALVVALYINSDDVTQFYRVPALLWPICPLLVYWLSRVWLLARRGKMHDDPIVFALRDRVSYAVGALLIVVAVLATWAPWG